MFIRGEGLVLPAESCEVVQRTHLRDWLAEAIDTESRKHRVFERNFYSNMDVLYSHCLYPSGSRRPDRYPSLSPHPGQGVRRNALCNCSTPGASTVLGYPFGERVSMGCHTLRDAAANGHRRRLMFGLRLSQLSRVPVFRCNQGSHKCMIILQSS